MLGVTLEPLKEKILANHSDQEVEAYQLKPRDFYLPYLRAPSRGTTHAYFLHEVALDSNDLPPIASAFAELRNRVAHRGRIRRETATQWRNQLLGVGCYRQFLGIWRM